jgi:hypothetical protein
VTLIESHMAMGHLAYDSVSLSKPFSFHVRVQNCELSLVRVLEIQLGFHIWFVKPSVDIMSLGEGGGGKYWKVPQFS